MRTAVGSLSCKSARNDASAFHFYAWRCTYLPKLLGAAIKRRTTMTDQFGLGFGGQVYVCWLTMLYSICLIFWTAITIVIE